MAGALRTENVTEAHWNRDAQRLYLRRAEQRVPPVRARESGAEHGIGILRSLSGREGEIRESGGVEHSRYVRQGIHCEGLTIDFFGIERERDGDQDRGNGGCASEGRISAEQSVRTLADGVLESGHSGLGR